MQSSCEKTMATIIASAIDCSSLPLTINWINLLVAFLRIAVALLPTIVNSSYPSCTLNFSVWRLPVSISSSFLTDDPLVLLKVNPPKLKDELILNPIAALHMSTACSSVGFCLRMSTIFTPPICVLWHISKRDANGSADTAALLTMFLAAIIKLWSTSSFLTSPPGVYICSQHVPWVKCNTSI